VAEAFTKSRFMRAMKSTEMPFGHADSHSPWLVQPPKPSLSMAVTMLRARSGRSAWPCGKRPRWVILAAVKRLADAFGHAATQAPQPMHSAASMAMSDTCFGMGVALASSGEPVRMEM
jgi:hypothetical protein